MLNNSHNNCHRNYTNGIFLHYTHFQINCSLHPMGSMPCIILRLWGFLCIRDAGCRGNKITGIFILITHLFHILTKQPTFCDATRLVCPWNDILETSAEIPHWWCNTTQIMGSASDWLKICFKQWEALPRSGLASRIWSQATSVRGVTSSLPLLVLS